MPDQSPLAASRALRWTFVAGVIAIPFDAIRGIPAVGELGNEASFPLFAAAIAMGLFTALRSGSNRLSSSLALKIGAGIVAAVLLSWAVNAAAIDSAMIRERSGENKFATSLLVILYGVGLAWLCEQFDAGEVRTVLTRAISWSAAIVAAYALFELIARQGPLSGLFNLVDGLVHTRQNAIINPWDGSVNYKVLYGWDARLRSVSFEPPAFGNFCGLAWPWLWFAAVTAAPARQLRAWALLAFFTLAVIVGQSRTGMLILGVELGGLLLLRWVYAARWPTGQATAEARVLLPVIAILGLVAAALFASTHADVIVAGIVSGDSVSDLSRLGFQASAFQMFAAHPLLGVGLGQFAFHAAQYLPDWAYRSSEVAPMLYYPDGPWPASYSLYARLAAELGLAGLIGWIGLWLDLAAALARKIRDRVQNGESGYGIEYPLALTALGILASAVATDTFRTPMIWIALGCSAAVVRGARAARREAATPAPEPRAAAARPRSR
ncbi:MAG: O-antigen ligase family protein [Sphingomicrobium sp.]